MNVGKLIQELSELVTDSELEIRIACDDTATIYPIQEVVLDVDGELFLKINEVDDPETVEPLYGVKEQLKYLFATRIKEAKETAVQIYATSSYDLDELKQRMATIQLLLGSLLGQMEMLLFIGCTQEELGITIADVKLIFTP